MSACPFICPHGKTRLPFDGFSGNLVFENFLKIYRENSTFINMTRITSILCEDLCTYVIISRWIPLGIRNVSDENYRVNQNTNFLFNTIFPKSRCLWGKVKKKRHGVARQATGDDIIRCMRFACWITKARIPTHTNNI